MERRAVGKGHGATGLGGVSRRLELYETGLGDEDTRGSNLFAAAKPWDGKLAPAKHLLIWTEQGLGDSLQFVRYAELCKERFGKVSVLCQKPLVRLFKSLPFVDDAFNTISDGSYFDEHVPLMSLPHLFGTVLETVLQTFPICVSIPQFRQSGRRSLRVPLA